MKTKKNTDTAFIEKAKTITITIGDSHEPPAPKICGGCLHDMAAFAAGAVMATEALHRHRKRHPKAGDESGEEAFSA